MSLSFTLTVKFSSTFKWDSEYYYKNTIKYKKLHAQLETDFTIWLFKTINPILDEFQIDDNQLKVFYSIEEPSGKLERSKENSILVVKLDGDTKYSPIDIRVIAKSIFDAVIAAKGDGKFIDEKHSPSKMNVFICSNQFVECEVTVLENSLGQTSNYLSVSDGSFRLIISLLFMATQ